MKWFLKCIREYTTFTGRARRTEFWMFQLVSFILGIISMTLDIKIFDYPYGGMPWFTFIIGLFILLPSLAVSVRRLHDTGRSGKNLLWYYIVGIVYAVALLITGFATIVQELGGVLEGAGIPMTFTVLLIIGLIGFLIWDIIFLVWFCTDSQAGNNKYGPNPKETHEA